MGTQNDGFDENDLADLGSEAPQASEGIPDEITSAFDSVFSNLSDADKKEIAEAGGEVEDTKTPPMSADQQARAKNLRSKMAKEQQDELEEEGLVSADNPDGEPVTAPAEKINEGDASQADTVAGAAKGDEVADKVDPYLRMAANEMGWTDDKINKFFEANPELATETMQTLADTYTNLSRQYLAIPGSQQAAGTPEAATTPPAQQQGPTSKLDQFYSQIEAFAETNGEDLANFAKSLKAELIDPVREILASNQAKQQELYATEARTTVSTLGEKFPQFYGTEGKALTDIERNNRAYLAQVADQLRAGAKAQGRELSIKDALHRAHLVATAGHRDQIVRKQIKEQVQSRSRQITAKPTQRRDPKLASGRSTANATEAVARKMAELGIEDSGE